MAHTNPQNVRGIMYPAGMVFEAIEGILFQLFKFFTVSTQHSDFCRDHIRNPFFRLSFSSKFFQSYYLGKPDYCKLTSIVHVNLGILFYYLFIFHPFIEIFLHSDLIFCICYTLILK